MNFDYCDPFTISVEDNSVFSDPFTMPVEDTSNKEEENNDSSSLLFISSCVNDDSIEIANLCAEMDNESSSPKQDDNLEPVVFSSKYKTVVIDPKNPPKRTRRKRSYRKPTKVEDAFHIAEWERIYRDATEQDMWLELELCVKHRVSISPIRTFFKSTDAALAYSFNQWGLAQYRLDLLYYNKERYYIADEFAKKHIVCDDDDDDDDTKRKKARVLL